MSAVEQFDDLAVYAAGGDADLVPLPALLLGSAQHGNERAFLEPELRSHLRAEVGGDLPNRAVAPGDAPLLRQRRQSSGVRDAVPGGSAVLTDIPKNSRDLAPVVAVGSGAGGHRAGQVARHNQVGVRPASSHLRPLAERIDAARPHVADVAAQAEISEPAQGLQGVVPVPDGLGAHLVRVLQHLLGGGVGGTVILAHKLSLGVVERTAP